VHKIHAITGVCASTIWCSVLAFALFAFGVTDSDAIGINVTQSADAHVLAHVTHNFAGDCSQSPTFVQQISNGNFTLATNIDCPTGAPALFPYASTVDLGILGDGQYRVAWIFVFGALGPVGSVSFAQSFVVKDGALVNDAVALPMFSERAKALLIALVGMAGCMAARRSVRRVP
jgi:hypothetical protein